ncbi:18830_t:CDS:1, partial [Funneliformis geosporum]
PDTSMDELIDVIEDLTNNDQYEDEYLDERDIFFLHSEENTSDENEESFDFNETELFTNPWKNNPTVFLAQIERKTLKIMNRILKKIYMLDP